MKAKEEKLILNQLSDRVFESIKNNIPLERRQALLIKLGIDTVLNVIPKLIVTIIIAVLLDELIPVVIFAFSFLALRSFAYGHHLKSDLLCTIITVATFIGIPYLVYLSDGIPKIGRLLICIPITAVIGILAPADTNKNPITSSVLRKKLKRRATLLAILLSISQMFLENYSGTLIVVSMAFASLLLVPEKGSES
ncbi:accessory gene regulator AgrB [Lactiplantibacillus paraplantarum]|uniref:accessory gene regulator AgrB n=1 Tax=Lactiplantibacillus paraplantarum TaxID=60520 RepID=UPI0007E3CC94|nr:accessory gene regulator AgrB [Lactiplantibacillus paraplantarum]MCW1911182.1 accessory gene regulator AgrB [Lactiplantibacillus paraplantarum]OAX74177.1 accessory regulator AgrB [Lactiplantibacillus plantarum]